MYELSILIPAKDEEFLSRTVDNICENSTAKTEVIVVIDGGEAGPPITKRPNVTVVRLAKSVGQRAATNIAARLSKAKYVAKCDAHCAFDKGFDSKLLANMREDWTVVPVMKNLHVFNWRCKECGTEVYQGPVPEGCSNENCGINESRFFEKVVKFVPRKNTPNSTAYRFTPTRLQFKYFGRMKDYQKPGSIYDAGNGLYETMSLQGSFFMLSREKYWELNICDESWGGWGQQGTEVAMKTWLSGGRVLCNTNTWYAHMFRTTSGFSHPWGNPGSQQEQARAKSADLFFNNKWEGQVRPVSWLIERFWEPLRDEPCDTDANDRKWNGEDLAKLRETEGRFERKDLTKGILYFTDNKPDLMILGAVQEQLRKMNLPIVSVSLKPLDFGQNIVLPLERGYLTMFKQILAGLEKMTTDIVFFCEHDVLYHPSHFDFTPTDRNTFYYNINVWKVRIEDGHSLWVDRCVQTSGLCGFREELIRHYRERIEIVERDGFNRNMGFEPATHRRIPWKNEFKCATWMAEAPNVDIRHDTNLTPNRWSQEQFRDKRNCEGWKEASEVPCWGKITLESLTAIHGNIRQNN